jgi:hypothetical protein
VGILVAVSAWSTTELSRDTCQQQNNKQQTTKDVGCRLGVATQNQPADATRKVICQVMRQQNYPTRSPVCRVSFEKKQEN